MAFKIIRVYKNAEIRRRTIATGLTLQEAQAHCKDPETSSRTCTLSNGKRRTRLHGEWFDAYEECMK